MNFMFACLCLCVLNVSALFMIHLIFWPGLAKAFCFILCDDFKIIFPFFIVSQWFTIWTNVQKIWCETCSGASVYNKFKICWITELWFILWNIQIISIRENLWVPDDDSCRILTWLVWTKKYSLKLRTIAIHLHTKY